MTKNLAISFVLDDDVEPGKVPRDASCEAVRALWEQLTDRPAEEHRFVIGAQDGPELPDDGAFVQFVDPDAPTATIFVQQLHKIAAHLVGFPEVCVELCASSETTTEQLTTQVICQLHIDSDRKIRFKVGDQVIEAESRVLNELRPGVNLQFDLELRILVLSMAAFDLHPVMGDKYLPVLLNFHFSQVACGLSKNREEPLAPPLFPKDEVKRVICFSSDTGEVLLPKTLPAECEAEEMNSQLEGHRIVAIDRKSHMPPNAPLLELMADAPLTSDLVVCLESRMHVRVENRITGNQSTVCLWPSSPLSDLLGDENECLLIDGEQVDPKQSLWTLGLQDGVEVVVTELVTLQVVDSRGRPHKLSADLHQPGMELYQHVTQLESANSCFRVWFDGRCLSRETRTLAQLGVKDHSQVSLVFRTRSVEVKAKERHLATFEDLREGTSFPQFLAMVRTATAKSLPEDTSFHCACGRVFSREGPLRSCFPLRCCEAAPLRFEMRVPEEQHFSGRWLDCGFRLPRGGASEVLEKLSRLATCGRAREWQELERGLVRALLALEAATAVQIRTHARLDLLLQLSSDVAVPWSVRPTDTVSEARSELEARTHWTFSDLALRGTRCLKTREKPTWTFADFRIVAGQRLTAIHPMAAGAEVKGPNVSDQRHSDGEAQTDPAMVLPLGVNPFCLPALAKACLASSKVVSDADWLTLYLFTGSELEARALITRGTKIKERLPKGTPMLHVAAWNNQPLLVDLLLQEGCDANLKDKGDKTALMVAFMRGHADVARLLIKSGCDLSAQDNDKRTALMYASSAGQLDNVQLIIESSCDLNMTDTEHRTALMFAIARNHTDVARLLIESGCDLNVKNCFGDTALSLSLSRDHVDLAQFLIESGCDINVKDNLNTTPLMLAVSKSRSEIAQLLISKGCNVDANNYDDINAFMIALSSGQESIAKVLIESGCNVNSKDKDEVTALMVASVNGLTDVARQLIEAGCDVNSKDKDKNTALILASMNGYSDISRLLVEADCDVSIKNKEKNTALILASMNGHTDVVRLLVDLKYSIQFKNKDHVTALMFACANGHSEIVSLLLHTGCDVNSTNRKRKSFLMCASENGHADIARILIDSGCDVNSKDKDSITAIMYASINGHISVARLLIESRCEVNIRSKNDETALMMACFRNHSDIVQLLLSAGSDINARDSENRTALIIAVMNDNTEAVKTLLTQADCDTNVKFDNHTALMLAAESNVVDIARELLAHGCDLNARGSSNRTALMMAASCGHADVVRLLGESPCDLQARDELQMTALMIACMHGHAEVVQLLTKAGLDVNARDALGSTPLMMAAKNGHADVARILIETKCDINVTDLEGTTSLMMATLLGHKDVVQLLIGAGCNVKARNCANRSALTYAQLNNHHELISLLEKALQ